MKKSNLRNYDVIPGSGTYIVKVANTVKPNYLIEDGSKSRYIVNLRCATIEGFERCLEKMDNHELIPFEEVRDCFMNGTIWENDLDNVMQLPTKGEEVIITVEKIDDIYRCTSITLIPRKKLDKFDLDTMCKSRNLFRSLLEKR